MRLLLVELNRAESCFGLLHERGTDGWKSPGKKRQLKATNWRVGGASAFGNAVDEYMQPSAASFQREEGSNR